MGVKKKKRYVHIRFTVFYTECPIALIMDDIVYGSVSSDAGDLSV